jgi:hypothetical protein
MKIREIEEDDLASVTKLFGEAFPRRRAAYWQRGFEKLRALPATASHTRYGYLLESDCVVRGALLTIGDRIDDGFARINLSSWCVHSSYRGIGVFLNAKATSCGARTYVNLSPAEQVVPIIDAFGFKPYTKGVCLLDARAALQPSRGFSLTRYDPHTHYRLAPASKIIAERHHQYGCVVLVLEGGPSPAELLVYRVKWIKHVLPCAQMLFGSPKRILGAVGPLMRHLLRRGIPSALMDIEEPINIFGAHNYIGRNLRYFKGISPAIGDLLYTEFAVFGP